MNLIIENNSNIELDDLISNQLIDSMKNYFISSIRDDKLIAFDNYINSEKLFKSNLYKSKQDYISTKDLLIECIDNLVYTKNTNLYIIEINSKKNSKKLDAKLIYISKLINYGNMQLAPYPIFTELFDYYAEIFPKIFEEYMETINKEE
jgi:hypothetical protein